MRRFVILLLSFFLISGFFLLSYAVDQTEKAEIQGSVGQDNVDHQSVESGQ